MSSRKKRKILRKDIINVFDEVREYVVINIGLGLIFILLFLLIDVEFVEHNLNRIFLISLEMLVAIFYILVQIIILIIMVIKKYKLSHKTIENLLKEDESNTLELKSSVRWDYKLNRVNKDLEHSILKTIAGFSNSDGGTLLIGVSDDKKIIGLQKDYATLKRKDNDGFVQLLTKIITNNLGKNIIQNLSINILFQSGKEVCRVDILPSKDPVFVSHNGNDEFYIRAANITIPLSVKETYLYLQRRTK